MNIDHSHEPQQVTANDTLAWRRRILKYAPSNGWSLSYVLAGPAILNFTAANGPDDFIIDVAGPAVPGEYILQGMASNGTERHTIYKEPLNVLVDVSTMTTAYDARTPIKIILDSIDAALSGNAANVILEMEVDGTRIKKMTPQQLMSARGVYALKYWREKNPGKLCPSVNVRFPGGYERFREYL